MANPVLLVHDDIAAIAALRRLLVRQGYEVMLATSAADAAIAFGHYLPSLIVLSPSVEGGRGSTVLHELAQQPDSRQARVVLLGQGIPGFNAAVVPVPIQPTSFLQFVDEVMRSPEGAWLPEPGQEAPPPEAPVEDWDPFGADVHPPLPSPRVEPSPEPVDDEMQQLEAEVRAEAARRRRQRESKLDEALVAELPPLEQPVETVSDEPALATEPEALHTDPEVAGFDDGFSQELEAHRQAEEDHADEEAALRVELEARRRAKQEAERQQAEEEEQRRAAELEAQRLAEEEAQRRAAEEEQQRAAELAARQRKEEEERQQAEAEQAARREAVLKAKREVEEARRKVKSLRPARKPAPETPAVPHDDEAARREAVLKAQREVEEAKLKVEALRAEREAPPTPAPSAGETPAELEQLQRERAEAQRRSETLAKEAAEHDRAAQQALQRVDELAGREKAAQAAATRAQEMAEAAKREATALAERLRREAEAAEEAARRERERLEQVAQQERHRLEQLAQQEREAREEQLRVERQEQEEQARREREAQSRLGQELERLREVAARAQAEAEAAQRLVAEERANREAEEKARKEAEQAAQRARDEARILAAKAEAALISIGDANAVSRIPRAGMVPVDKLGEIVFELIASRSQVRLELKAKDVVRVLWFRDGLLVGAVSSDPHESLLQRARRDGLIDARQQAELALLRGASSAELIEALRERGYLREEEAVPLLQRHTEQIALDALSEPEALYRLSEEPLPPEVPLAVTPRLAVNLLAEALRRGLDPQALTRIVGGLHGVPSPVLQPRIEPERLELSERERRLLKQADGESTNEQLLLASGLKQEAALKLLAVARLVGLIEVRIPEGVDAPGAAELEVRRLEAKYEELQEADYFVVLGLSRSAGREEVLRAFQHLASEFNPLRFAGHPDLGLQRRAEQVHAYLAEAAQALQDDRLRAQYARNLVD